MWTTSQPKQVEMRARPPRVAYIVPPNPSSALLDELFDECMSRWGGRRTPILESDGSTLEPEGLALLNLWDADIIYCYVALAPSLRRRLNHLFAPSDIQMHEGIEDNDVPASLAPDIGTNWFPLSSLSLLPHLAARTVSEGSGIPRILDKERWSRVDRDLEDSFGFASNSHSDVSLLPACLRLSFRPASDTKYAPRFKEPEEIAYLADVKRLEIEIADRGALLTMSQISDMLCPYLNPLVKGPDGWDDHLTIIVGDEVPDRLLFWNSIHRYTSLYEPGNYQVLRVSPKRFEEGNQEWLKTLCSGVRNRRHLPGNQAPRIVLRSCSLSEGDLESIKEKLQSSTTMIRVSRVNNPVDLFAPLVNEVRGKRKGMKAWFPSIWNSTLHGDPVKVRYTEGQFEIPLVEPAHIREASRSAMTRGAWIVDLRIERAENHSQYDNRPHHWQFPRRLRLERSFNLENYGRMIELPPRTRPTERGDLSIMDTRNWPRPIVNVATDVRCFLNAIATSKLDDADDDHDGSDGLGDVVQVSDKGRDLLGILQLFRSLPEALSFLTNPYLLSVIEKLSPDEPAKNAARIALLARDLKGVIDTAIPADIDFTRLARRALSLAARSISSGSGPLFVGSKDLINMLPQHENNKNGREDLEEAVTYLRDRGFLQQGWGWRCSMCQHRNWVNIEDLAPVVSCEICKTKQSTPVSKSLHFRLNSFVIHAFASTSAQGPVIWALYQLAMRAKWCFAFTPSLEIVARRESKQDIEIDIIAAVDAKVFLVEVKTSFSGATKQELEKLCDLAIELRPDVAMLAVPRPTSHSSVDAELLTTIETRLDEHDIEFELLTSDSPRAFSPENGVPQPYERAMTWSVW